MDSAVLNDQSSLTEVLVRVSRECGVRVEHLRAEQLLRDAQSAWPGDEQGQWSKWLRETAECLSLRSRVTEIPLDQALGLAQDGALLVGGYRPEGGVTILLGYDGRHAEVADGELDNRRRLSRAELARELAPRGAEAAGDADRWVVVEHPELNIAEESPELRAKPLKRLIGILQPEWPDIWLILVFAFFAAVLNLATPIAVEALVNTVAFGRLFQPVIVLATILFAFLAFAAVMKAMQTYAAEVIQRRLMARVSADLAYRLPRVETGAFGGYYGPTLVNQFLDVVTLQKVVAQLLLDGVSIVLATLVGMAVLAFYHPWLLGFDILLLFLVTAGVRALGAGAVSSGIDESKMKYRIAAWFEDIVRCPRGFKSEGGAEFAIDRANLLTANYLAARRQHFRILFRQIVFILALQVFAGVVLLGGGGWLVIQGQLTLGQLVAAELIVATILSSLAKLGKHLEGYYDLMASVDKLGGLFDLGVERHDGVMNITEAGESGREIAVEFTNLRCRNAGPLLTEGLTDRIEAGERVALYGPQGSGKSLLLRLLYGLETPLNGHLEVGGCDPRDLRPDILRSHVALVGSVELFDGTIAENIHLRRPSVSTTAARQALDAVGLLDAVLLLPDGIETRLNASGTPLSSTQQQLVVLARALAGRPSLLLIDGLLDGLPDGDVERLVTVLTRPEHRGSVVVATGKRSIAERFDRRIALDAAPGANPARGSE